MVENPLIRPRFTARHTPESTSAALTVWKDQNKNTDIITLPPAETWRYVAKGRNDFGPTSRARNEQVIQSLRENTLPVLLSQMANDSLYGKTEETTADTAPRNIRHIIYDVTTDDRVKRRVLDMANAPLRHLVYKAFLSITASQTPITAKTRQTQQYLSILEDRGIPHEEVIEKVMALNFDRPKIKLWPK
jgi:hypothetical protein